jgi:hypothetical protein
VQRADTLAVEAEVLGEGLRHGELGLAVRARGEMPDRPGVFVCVSGRETLAVSRRSEREIVSPVRLLWNDAHLRMLEGWWWGS